MTYPKEKFKLQAFSQMILLNRGDGKDWAGPFFHPPPLKLYPLLYSFTVSEYIPMTYVKEIFDFKTCLA